MPPSQRDLRNLRLTPPATPPPSPLRPLTLSDIPRLMLAFTFIYLAASDYSPAWMLEPEGGAKDLVSVGSGPGGDGHPTADDRFELRFGLKHSIDPDPTLHQERDVRLKPSNQRSS